MYDDALLAGKITEEVPEEFVPGASLRISILQGCACARSKAVVYAWHTHLV